jgi:cytochrome c oxidase cbb3-type subunit 3
MSGAHGRLPFIDQRRTVLKIAVACVALLAVLAAAVGALRSREDEAAVLRADPERILSNPILLRTAVSNGRPVYERTCAACHGDIGKGDTAMGVPDLTDGKHLYGTGTVAQTEDIVRYGIRARNKRGWNLAVMPAYATAVPDKAQPLPPQTPAQVEALTQYVLALTGRATDLSSVARGRAAYDAAGCWDCHGHDAAGDTAIGAPDLTDDSWLYGGSHDQIYATIARGRAGMSPAFIDKLTPAEIRNVAVYAASLSISPAKPR